MSRCLFNELLPQVDTVTDAIEADIQGQIVELLFEGSSVAIEHLNSGLKMTVHIPEDRFAEVVVTCKMRRNRVNLDVKEALLIAMLDKAVSLDGVMTFIIRNPTGCVEKRVRG